MPELAPLHLTLAGQGISLAKLVSVVMVVTVLAETPLYRQLGAKPESSAPKGRGPRPHSDKGVIERVIFRSYRFGNLAAISFNI